MPISFIRLKAHVTGLLLLCSMAGFSQVTLTASLGAATGSFTTLKGAFDAINAGTHQGAIVISINASTTESASAALNASGSSSSSYTSINIYPTTTGLSISGDLEAPLIDLNGADSVTIDGRVNASGSTSLVITNNSILSTAGTSTIRLINDASYNTVKYCTLKGSSTAAAAGIVFFSTTTGTTGNDNNSIDHNDITCAADASRPLNAVYALGTDLKNNDNNSISNNNIYNFLSRATASNGISISSYNSAFTISGNSFYETASFTPSSGVAYSVIQISAATGNGNGFTVSGNYIGGSSPLCALTAWTKTGQNNAFTAISVGTATGTANNIQCNTIQNISWTNSNSSNFTGISVSGATVANIGTTTGNTIGAATGTGSINFKNGLLNTGNFNCISLSSTALITCKNNTIASITLNLNSSNNINFRGIYLTGFQEGTSTISNNTIGSTTTAGSINAASLQLNGIESSGTGTNTFSGNTIANLINASKTASVSISGINVTAGTNTISGNTVYNLSSSYASSASASISGINVTAGTNTISGNTVYNLSNSYASFAGGVIGIYYSGSTMAGTVSGNFIHSLSVSGASSTAANLYGIKINAGAATYSNNIISLGGNTTTNLYGIYETGLASNNNNLYFNSVYLSGSLAAGATNTSYALYSAVNTNSRDFRNNVLVNARSTASGASKHYGLYIVSSGGTLTCDYNNYYVSGTGGMLGYYAADKSSATIVTGNDANSISTNPAFSSTGTTASGYLPTVLGTGVSATGITVDYAGNLRAAAVKMGALTPCANPTEGGTIAAAQSGYNPFTPAAFTSSVAASGQTGTIEYKWQSSTTSNSAGFSDIASSNAATYTPGALTVNTWYKRLARVTCKSDWTGAVESNVLAVTVTNCINPNVGGTIAAAQSGYNPFTPAAFTSSVAASGETGTIEYKWQSSTTSNSAGFIDIPSSNAATYDAGSITQSTWYKRLARVSCKSDWTGAVESNVLEVSILCKPATPVVSVTNNCDGTSTLSTTASGTLLWSTGATTSSISVSVAGDYTVTQTLSGCANTSAAGSGTAAPKTTPAAPVVSVTNNCDGTSTLSTTASGTLLWSTGATTSSINVSAAGDYTVTQTVNGCASAAGSGTAAPKTTPAAPVVSVTNNCDGTSTLSTTASGTLLWSTGATSSSISVSAAGDYTVTQTVNGCASAAGSGTAAPKTTPAAPVVSVTNNCDGTSTLSTTASGTLLWSTGATSSSISVSAAGDYTVTQTVNGCASAAGSGVAAPKTMPTSGGTIATAQSGNAPFNPVAFTSSAAASGHTGTLEYKWQSSTTSSSADFSDITSTYEATYDAGALTVTTWFKRLARVACSSDWSGAAESNVLEVTVTPLLAEPLAQPTHLFFTNSGSAEPYNLSVNFTASASASGYLVVRKTATAPTFVPVDGTTYTAGAQGSDQIIYVGSANAATDLAVTTGTEYHYKIYAYGGSGPTINYLTADPLSGKSIVKITNTEAINNTTQSVSAGFPTAGVNITFPAGTTGGTISAVKTSSSPDANFSALPGVRSVATQYFTIISTNAGAGNYTLTLDFSALGLSPSEWSNFIILKRADATAPWVDMTSLGATILNRQTDGVWGKFTITGLSSFSDFSGGAAATTFTVTTGAETGAGSLKQAVIDARSGDFIRFDTIAMGTKTITLTSPVVMDKSLAIQGANGGITLNGNGVTRVMDIRDAVVVRLDRLKIENGSGSTGLAGGIWNNGSLTMVNCVVSGNAETGDFGTGGILQYSALTDNQSDVLNLVNCTLSGNSGFTSVGDKGIGGLSVRNGTASIYNTIIYGNTGDGSSDVDKRFSITLADHSDIGNLADLTITTNTANISTDPGFAGAANAAHPYAITGSSPAADAGSNSWCLETTDIRGGSFGRKLNKTNGSAGTIDMGAYEFGANAWTGASSNNFNTATNWSYGTVPATGENFNIPNGNPQLNVDYTVGGTMIISGTGKLTINAGKTLTVGASGTADFGGKAVTIKSDATGTGAIGKITGTLTGASNVTVERYIATAKRAWRLLSLPLTGTTLRNAWGGVAANASAPTGETAGSGTLLTGHGATYGNGTLAAAAGYDWYSGLTANSVSSIRFYNDANVWASATNTPSLVTTPDKYGYLVFLRGDRTVTTGSGTTTLNPTGTLKTGTQTMAISNAYEIIGNPYASSIDLDSVYNNSGNSTKISRNFWVWDATLGTSGAYRTLSYNASSYDMTGGSGNAADYLKVQSGQAFFVQKTTAGNITIEESNKTANASVVLLGAEPVNTVGKVSISLYQATGSTLTTEMDGVLARFGSAYQTAPTDDYDVAKISNFNENMGLLRGNSYLSIESRPFPVKTDTLFAPFWNLTSRTYALKIGSTGIGGQIQGARLLDAFTKTETALNLNEGGTITYPFSVTADPASSSLDRFAIVMTAAQSLPVSFTNVNATPKTTGIDVTWKTATEVNVKDYSVERSSDGLNFTAFNNKAALNATNGAAYNYLDLQPLTGKNYYRIRSNDRGGDYRYSGIATAQWNGKAGMGVFPTAINQGQFTVQLSNQPAGNYKLALTTIAGRLLFSQAISHGGGSGSYGVKTGSLAVSAGVYQLTITSPDGQQQSFRLLITK